MVRWGFLLAPLSLAFRFGSSLRNFLYDFKILPTYSVQCPVVSIGNIVAGGTGKTPLTLLLAERFSHRKVAILSRGYGKVADEALLLQKRLPKARVYVGKDRVASARLAVKEGAELILLDDGFQHRRLFRDFDLVILSNADASLERHFLPWGRLRDSPRRIKKASAILVNSEKVAASHIGIKIALKQIPTLSDQEVGIFCAIAHPDRFKKTVLGQGAKVVYQKYFADHSTFSPRQLTKIASEAKALGAKILVCTEKDIVKIPPGIPLELPLFPLSIHLEIHHNAPLWENLIAKIEQKIDTFLYV